MTPKIHFDPKLGIVLITYRYRYNGIDIAEDKHVISREVAVNLRNQLGTILVLNSQELDALEDKWKAKT